MVLAIDITRDEALVLLAVLSGSLVVDKQTVDAPVLTRIRAAISSSLAAPVFKDEKGRWWYMDESWLRSYGPFKSKLECLDSYRKLDARSS